MLSHTPVSTGPSAAFIFVTHLAAFTWPSITPTIAL